jgi:hypothetical protein
LEITTWTNAILFGHSCVHGPNQFSQGQWELLENNGNNINNEQNDDSDEGGNVAAGNIIGTIPLASGADIEQGDNFLMYTQLIRGFPGKNLEELSAPAQNVTNLRVTSVTTNSIRLTWDTPTLGAVAYRLKKATGSTPPLNCKNGAIVSGPDYTFSGLSSSTTYSFRVCSLNGTGIESSGVTLSQKTTSSGSGDGDSGNNCTSEGGGSGMPSPFISTRNSSCDLQ